MKINKYSFGQIIIDSSEYRSDVIIYPDRVDAAWWRKEGHRLSIDDLKDAWPLKPTALVVGTGSPGLLKVDREVEECCRKEGIELVVLPTAQAVERYNQLAAAGANVAAALHLTC